jgi:tetratricopeptide (TPR) repeat protein
MNDTRRQRYEQALDVFGQPPVYAWKQLMVAICLTQLDKYPNAQHYYDLALQGFLKDRRGWHGTSQPNRLVDTYVLASQSSLSSEVWQEVEAYKLDPRGNSLWALYAYAMVRLMLRRDEEAVEYVPGLLKRPKIKDTFAMGRVVKAIIEHDQSAFDAALDGLLKAHRGMAKFGGLRETPEGFLCLPAMSLSKMALERSMKVNAKSEYLSKGYLDYLSRQQNPAL